MTIDNSTKFKITNKFLYDSSICTLKDLVKDHRSEMTIESIMIDPAKECKLIAIDISHVNDPAYLISSSILISNACFCLAICCYIGQTDACRSLVAAVLKAYIITIVGAGMQARNKNTKDILKELVNLTIEKHEELFEKAAKKLGII